MHCSCISGTHWDVGTCCSPKRLPYTSCASDPSQLWMCLSFPFISPLPWLSFGSDPICSVEMAGAQHFLAVGADHGVAKDGSGAGEVPKGRKEPLGPGVDDQQPVERWGTEVYTSNCTRFPTQGAAEPMPEAGPTWPGLRPHIRPH